MDKFKGVPYSTAGFTFLEVIIISIIISILTAIIAPAYANVAARYRLYTAARMIAGDILETRERVIAEDCNEYHLSFFTDPSRKVNPDKYTVWKGTPLNPPIKTAYLAKGINLYTTNFDFNSLTFNTHGAPYPQGGTITLEDEWGHLYYVIIASITGRVRVDDKPPASWEIAKP